MNRREFLHFMSLAGASAMIPGMAFGANPAHSGKIVVLIHLKGGNDGFNTLVPFEDPEYYKLRPRIGVEERTLLKLKDGMGMHPQLKQLQPLWQKNQLAWIQGVGYERSPLSHFQSLDIWESASPNDYSRGWLSHVVPNFKRDLHGVVIDNGVEGGGVMSGSNFNSITMQNPKSFIHAVKNVEEVNISKRNAAIEHVTSLHSQLHSVGRQIAQKVGDHPKVLSGKYSGQLGHGLQAVAQMILSGVDAPVYKVTQGGFDTHAGQITRQGNSLFQLANGIQSFARVMEQAGLWNNVLVMTYSEFGRRAAENRGGGTDHGTASTHLVCGGSVRGGIYGQHPDMSKLDANGNVQPSTDFRALYGTVANKWWRQGSPWGQYGTVPFIG